MRRVDSFQPHAALFLVAIPSKAGSCALLISCICFTLCPRAHAQQLDLPDLIAAHQQSVDLVFSFVAHVKLFPTSDVLNTEIIWFHQRSDDRLITTVYQANDKNNRYTEGSNTAMGCRFIQNRDPAKPTPLSLHVDGPEGGSVSAYSDRLSSIGIDPRAYLMRAFQNQAMIMSVKEGIEKALAKKLVHTPDTKWPYYVIEAELSAMVNRLWLDPSRNFALVRVESRAKNETPRYGAATSYCGRKSLVAFFCPRK